MVRLSFSPPFVVSSFSWRRSQLGRGAFFLHPFFLWTLTFCAAEDFLVAGEVFHSREALLDGVTTWDAAAEDRQFPIGKPPISPLYGSSEGRAAPAIFPSFLAHLDFGGIGLSHLRSW